MRSDHSPKVWRVERLLRKVSRKRPKSVADRQEGFVERNDMGSSKTIHLENAPDAKVVAV